MNEKTFNLNDIADILRDLETDLFNFFIQENIDFPILPISAMIQDSYRRIKELII